MMRRLLYGLLVLMGLLGMPALALAQTNPTSLVFTASPDHAIVVNGTPVLTRYDVVVKDGQGATVATVPLGKPTPAAPVPPATIGDITVPATPMNAALTRSGTYTATLVAVGPGGSTSSVPSDPFPFWAPPAATGKPSAR